MILQILGLVAPILERIIPDPNKRMEAEREIQKALIENQAALNQSMADVMKADAASEGMLTRNARPFAVFWAIFMVSYVGIIAPLFGIQKETIDGLKAVPSELWNIIAVFGGGYILAKAGVEIAKAAKGK
jgi:hypothetical protein